MLLGNPNYTTELLKLINDSVKLQDTKLIYKNQLNFYILVMSCQRNQETNLIFSGIKTAKYLGINLTKEVMKETNKWK